MTAPDALDGFFDALGEDDAVDLYERAPIGYLSTTADGLIIKVNQTLLAWTGYDRDALVGHRHLTDLLTGGGKIYHETHYAPLLRMQGKAREIALDIVRADGSKFPALLNSVVVSAANGEREVVRTAIFDATERRQYERELMAAKRRAEESEAQASLLAQTLQRTLLPPTPPRIPGLEVGADYRPARGGDVVGGDFYDAFEVADGDWVIILGDVQGKGVEAAVLTTLIRYTVRAAAIRFESPAEIFRTLNDVMRRDETDRLSTAVLIRLAKRDDGSWTATVGLAGHDRPYMVDASGQIRAVGTPGSLIGVFPQPDFTDETHELRVGDVIVAFTDGVTEGRAGEEWFGEDRLKKSIVRHAESPQKLAAGVVADVVDFQDADLRDDIAVVAVGVKRV